MLLYPPVSFCYTELLTLSNVVLANLRLNRNPPTPMILNRFFSTRGASLVISIRIYRQWTPISCLQKTKTNKPKQQQTPTAPASGESNQEIIVVFVHVDVVDAYNTIKLVILLI